MPTVSHSSLSTGLLAAVSRSFYLSLRFLPRPVRHPLSLSYLLARAADTLADVATQPTTLRLDLLRRFHQAVQGSPDIAFFRDVAAFAKSVEHRGERILLERLPECFTALAASAGEERHHMSEVLGQIVRGMTLDLNRFPDASSLRELLDDSAVEEYIWLVAGCVGKFWTEICALHLPQFATVEKSQMIEWGETYGKGLQLVNILRDQPKDLAEGRCYLPGCAVFNFAFSESEKWHAVRQPWIVKARGYLAEGRLYVQNLRGVRLRFAALLPLMIGGETLTLLEAPSPSQMPVTAKVNRADIKRLMRLALWRAIWNRG